MLVGALGFCRHLLLGRQVESGIIGCQGWLDDRCRAVSGRSTKNRPAFCVSETTAMFRICSPPGMSVSPNSRRVAGFWRRFTDCRHAVVGKPVGQRLNPFHQSKRRRYQQGSASPQVYMVVPAAAKVLGIIRGE
jgi:hypothetical protein